MKMIQEKYDGKVPDNFNELLALPGVGRKSANLIMGDVFGKPGYCDGYPLYPPGEPYGAGGSYQGSKEGRNGIVEADPA